MPTMTVAINLVPVVTPGDVEVLRLIRNEAREWLFDGRYLTSKSQVAWWKRNHRSIEPWLIDCTGQIAGYCMVRKAEGAKWITLVLTPSYRGQGIGTEIYRLMLRKHKRLSAGIRSDNIASRKAAEKAGFKYKESQTKNMVTWDFFNAELKEQ